MPRRRLHIDGIVQGVGFRPFVFNLAEALGLVGWVSNTSDGVFVEIEGDAGDLDVFGRRLAAEAPPLASITDVDTRDIEPSGDDAFEIRVSKDTPGTSTLVPPDYATCDDCLREIRDPHDRRHGYPFTNCTNCGPRWTIIDRIPYDRPFTSMAKFRMCDTCRDEYEDPRDRRFHAQPNACPECGPRLWLDGDHVDAAAPPLGEAARLLAAGRIVAVKGLGGFHLAVRADDDRAVRRLRKRKNREAKPLALMIADLDAARRLAEISNAEASRLASPHAPIVLVRRRAGGSIAASVAPGHRRLGVMLPYTPLHHLLWDELAALEVPALVMTSGNLGDEPICLDNDEARARLTGIADAWLLHDRDILRRVDDTVLQVHDGEDLLFRRSRGLAPVPVHLRSEDGNGPTVLAVGGELKNAICLLHRQRAFPSPHIGDVENLSTYEFFRETVTTLTALLEAEPEVLACDSHPGYLTSRWARAEARRRNLPLIEVQHHHAHMVAVMAEYGLNDPCLGLVLDGTGYGDDGTIWGGEILMGDAAGYRRLGHLDTVPLPGGDAAIRHPWRTAVSYLRHGFGDDIPELPFLEGKKVAPVLEIVDKGINAPLTSSCGRLFDAVAAMTGGWDVAGYEAQAAVELTAATTLDQARAASPFSFALSDVDGRCVIDVRPLVRDVAAAVRDSAATATVSARFHRTLADALVEATARTTRDVDVSNVVLAGGSFQNHILLTLVAEELTARGLNVQRPRLLSPNDGALGLGQAVIARAVLRR